MALTAHGIYLLEAGKEWYMLVLYSSLFTIYGSIDTEINTNIETKEQNTHKNKQLADT